MVNRVVEANKETRAIKVNLDRIKELAKAKDLKISQLEAESNLTNGTIGKWEKVTPTANSLYFVADTLDTSMEYLLDLEITDKNGNTSLIPLTIKKPKKIKKKTVYKYCSMCGKKL